MVGGIQPHYPNTTPLHKPEQQLNLGPQTYSVHSKGMQDPRQQKLLMDQQQPRVALNSPYIKQVSSRFLHFIYVLIFILFLFFMSLGKLSPGITIGSR